MEPHLCAYYGLISPAVRWVALLMYSPASRAASGVLLPALQRIDATAQYDHGSHAGITPLIFSLGRSVSVGHPVRRDGRAARCRAGCGERPTHCAVGRRRGGAEIADTGYGAGNDTLPCAARWSNRGRATAPWWFGFSGRLGHRHVVFDNVRAACSEQPERAHRTLYGESGRGHGSMPQASCARPAGRSGPRPAMPATPP